MKTRDTPKATEKRDDEGTSVHIQIQPESGHPDDFDSERDKLYLAELPEACLGAEVDLYYGDFS